MKISQKLILAFLLVALLASVTALFTLRSYRDINETFAEMIDDPTHEILVLNDVKHSGIHLVSLISRHSHVHREAAQTGKAPVTEEEKRSSTSRHEAFETHFKRHKEVLQTIALNESMDRANIRIWTNKLLHTSDEITELIRRDNTDGNEFREKRAELDANETIFLKYIDEAVAKEANHQIQHQKDVQTSIDLATRQTLTVMALTFVLAIVAGLYISLLISRRIQNLKNAFEKVGKGELETKIETASIDEIGDLSRSFNKMVADVRGFRSNLAAAQLFTKKVLESMINFVVVTDMDLRITQVNKAAVKLNGFEEHELIGKSANM